MMWASLPSWVKYAIAVITLLIIAFMGGYGVRILVERGQTAKALVRADRAVERAQYAEGMAAELITYADSLDRENAQLARLSLSLVEQLKSITDRYAPFYPRALRAGRNELHHIVDSLCARHLETRHRHRLLLDSASAVGR